MTALIATPLRPVNPLDAAPTPGPLDELAAIRLRRMLIEFFGPFPTLDAHLALLDRQGAWYATKALGAWSSQLPDAFFGVARHVVRTQLPGPAPTPDIEAWLAAGRPGHDQELAGAWDKVRSHRYPGPPEGPIVDRAASTPAAVARVDEIVSGWPADHFGGFVYAYASIECVLETRQIVFPPIDG